MVPAKKEKSEFNIAEVSNLTGIKAHVLRYWESEFPQLKPEKSRAGQRVYQQKDVDIVLHLKRLLYEDQYTVAGARKKLESDLKQSRREQMPLELNLGEAEMAGTLMKVRRQVKSLLDQLSRPLPLDEVNEEEAGESA
jgi:DNA-binding transcriptional MerR regulator